MALRRFLFDFSSQLTEHRRAERREDDLGGNLGHQVLALGLLVRPEQPLAGKAGTQS